MPITIGQNISSLKAQTALSKSDAQRVSAFERLSSGLRINHPSDDAAGLAIASTLSTQGRLHGTAIRNINDAISYLSVTEGAIGELSSITLRIAELAEQAANGSFSQAQRAAIDREGQQLAAEFNRIVQSTKFNGQILLNGTTGPLAVQIGITGGAESVLSVGDGYALRSVVGDGTFSAFGTVATVASADEVAEGDFNGDGKQDLLVLTSAAHLFLGNGDGTFKARISVGTAGSSVVSGDINSDGLSDFAMIVGANVQIRLSNGDGTFSAQNASAATATAVRLADLNGDGRLDLYTREASAGDEVFTYMGNGNGTFLAPTAYLVAGPRGAEAGDIDGDGDIDLVVGRLGLINILRNTGAGNFSIESAIDGNGFVQLGDLDGDQDLDITYSGPSAGISIKIGNGDGTFKAGSLVVNDSNGGTPRVRDLNADGYDDIIRPFAGAVQVFLSNGNGTFLSPVSYSLGAGAGDIALSDFTGDGVTDITYSGGADSLFGLYKGNGRYNYGLPEFSLSSVTDALEALDAMRTYLDDLSQSASRIGASRSRLEFGLRNHQNMQENTLAAAARITDADIALESAQAVRAQILRQAGAAVLAQANLQPRLVLGLLGK